MRTADQVRNCVQIIFTAAEMNGFGVVVMKVAVVVAMMVSAMVMMVVVFGLKYFISSLENLRKANEKLTSVHSTFAKPSIFKIKPYGGNSDNKKNSYWLTSQTTTVDIPRIFFGLSIVSSTMPESVCESKFRKIITYLINADKLT